MLYDIQVPIFCILSSGYGGLLYLFRAIYVNKCVNNNWNDNWHIWYYIRPITSMLSGGIAYIFLKAGLLILETEKIKEPTNFGFYALAFIAGLNVDNFVKKLEDIAKTVFGIDKSNLGKEDAKLKNIDKENNSEGTK
jgi:hypothetical protein